MKKMTGKLKKLLVAFCCMVSLIVTGTVNITAIEDFEIIDDVDERFEYSGAGDANHGGWESSGSGNPEATEHWSNSAGATLDIHFNGTKLELYGKKDPSHAKFSVQIDDGETVKCDAYAPSKMLNEKLYESEELSAGDHIAHITVLGERNENAKPSGPSVYGVQFVYAKAFNVEVTEPEFPGYTNIDDAVLTKTNEPFKIQYEPVSAWHAESGYTDLFFDGTDHYSDKDVNDAYYTMDFTGTGIEIYASKNPDHTNCDVYIDGELVGQINANGPKEHKLKLFEKKDLENRSHTLKVVKQGNENKAMQVDRVVVFHDEIIVPTAIALNQTELTLIPGAETELTTTATPWFVDANLVWKSSNDKVVSVEDGVLTVSEDVKEKTTVTITASVKEDEEIFAQAKVTIDPALAFMNAYVGNEKLLDTELDFDELKGGSGSVYKATAWLKDELNSKIVVATNKDVHDVEVTASDFKNEAGQVLAKENIDIKWLKEVSAKEGRNAAGLLKKYPDMIHKGGKKDIEANDVMFAWLNISVPENTVPGVYHGVVEVSAKELSESFKLQYTIEVINLVQPEPEATELQVWQHPFSVANYYLGLGEKPSSGITNEVKNDFYFTEEHFNLMRESIKEYVSIGGHDAVANIVEEAWNHQSYYNDLSMVKWTKKSDGSWEFDYDWYDKWIDFMIECGVLDPENGIGQIKCYSIVPWNNQIAYFDETQGKMVEESHNPGSKEWKAMWKPFLEDFLKHSKEKGWFEITYISMDERGLDQLEPAVEMIESVTDEDGNHFKISSALNYSSPDTYEFTDRIDDISINLGNTGNVKEMKALSNHRRELGLVTTMYTCTGDYPSNFMISDPGDNYWDIWYTMTLETDGYMRWAWDNYVYDMHGNATYRYWEPGDGWFIYPEERENLDESYNASFYSTPRYELFKQGIRDVAKAKYLLNSDSVTEEQKAALEEVVGNLKKPNGTKYQQAAVPATEADRMLVHSETARALEATNKLAREVAEEITGSVDKAELENVIVEAEKLNKDDYTADSWKVFETALVNAKEVLANEEATDEDVVEAIEALKAAIAQLEKKPTITPEPDPEKPGEGEGNEGETTPETGDATNTTALFMMLVLAGGVLAVLNKNKIINFISKK